jgi:hypothetical protein
MSTGKVFPKAPVRIEKAMAKTGGGGSYKITIRKMFDAERKELTDKLSPANIL